MYASWKDSIYLEQGELAEVCLMFKQDAKFYGADITLFINDPVVGFSFNFSQDKITPDHSYRDYITSVEQFGNFVDAFYEGGLRVKFYATESYQALVSAELYGDSAEITSAELKLA